MAQQHSADHFVRNDQRPVGRVAGDQPQGCSGPLVRFGIALPARKPPSVFVLGAAAPFAGTALLDLVIGQL
jgi:hypothetical protein